MRPWPAAVLGDAAQCHVGAFMVVLPHQLYDECLNGLSTNDWCRQLLPRSSTCFSENTKLSEKNSGKYNTQ